MILDQTTDRFFASSSVRLALGEATKLINSDQHAEAQVVLDDCLRKALDSQTTSGLHDIAVLYVYTAIAADAGHESERALEILSEGILTISSRDPSERFYQSRLFAVQLWLLEKAGKYEDALSIAKLAVEKIMPPTCEGGLTNMYLEDLYFQYSSLLQKRGEDELALATLQGIADRCAHALTNYGPLAFMEEGKFERFWLNQIATDARAALAMKGRSREAPQG